MKQVRGWYLPDEEEHLSSLLERSDEIDGRGTYQFDKLKTAVSFCKRFDLAVDVGANVGLWSWHLARIFKQVEAFEPFPDHISCFALNCADLPINLHAAALGNYSGIASLQMEGTGTTSSLRVKQDGLNGVTYAMGMLDNYPFRQPVDFLKIDCEGYEFFVLKGGWQTIKRDKPVICIEQKKGHGRNYGIHDRAGVKRLESIGYRVEAEMRGDFIMTCGWE